MRIIRSLAAMLSYRRTLQREGVRIGLVPTMGALHEGHRALIRAARLSCDAVVVSIFVNPTQFGPQEDFSRYPRRFKQDAAMCRAEGIDVLFAPTRNAMYPPGFQTSVITRQVSRLWEGAARPIHFEGVATVITKLLSVVRPDTAFFGQKDFQQTVVVRRVAEDLNTGVRIVRCPTVRETDGLALSSRNIYLTPAQRRAAPILYAALKAGEAAIRRGVKDVTRVRRAMLMTLASEPLARMEYLAACDPESLEPLTRISGKAVLLGAIRLGSVRLIDNVLAPPTARGRRRKNH